MQCNPGLAIKALFEQLYTPPTKLMIVGGGCSVVSEVTARASHLWNLVQVILFVDTGMKATFHSLTLLDQ